MSRENIELHERGIEALNARVLSDELAAETLAPGFRIENAATAITDKTYYGPEGVREWVRDIFEGFDEDARYELEEILADGDDFVVARVRLVGHGARSGAPVELRWVAATWYEDGKATRSAGYLRRSEALEAVGLSG
jgi:ketosteroid isomerase-like protein